MVLFSAVKIFDVDRRFIGVLIERGITRSRYRQIVIGGIKAQEFILHESKTVNVNAAQLHGVFL